MKKLLIYAAIGACAFTSCSKEKDLYTGTQESTNQEAINANVKSVFGTTFAADHDWCSTVTGEVTINVDPSEVKKVQLMVYTEETNVDNETIDVLKVLNEEDVDGRSTFTLKYDAPSTNKGYYAAFISDKIYVVKKVKDNTVTYSGSASSRLTRAISTDFTLPTVELKIGVIEDSYANTRGWVPGEKLYQMADYTAQRMDVANYDDDTKDSFRALIFSYFKNGRSYNNLPLVKSSGLYNDKVYPITTGSDPIILSPIYKRDGGSKYGDEVLNSDLYYYYFKEEDLGSDPVAYLESLPKYKAIQFNQAGLAEDVISKQSAYALVYWGEGVPTEETVGSYIFPSGYKIGFMIRSKTTTEGGKKQGELYGDGRLNNYVNNADFLNFKSSKLGTDGPRMAWLTVNNKMLLCCESGTDTDFNDIILEIEGGVEPFIVVPELEKNAYTYCYEDTELGDYDMNDVVIKATRSGNKVTYTVVACGANDELYIMNINAGTIKDNTEVHALFGKKPSSFINTEQDKEKCEYVSGTKTVNSDFSFLDDTTQPYLFNKTKNRYVYLSKAGQDPHAIMLPNDFLYPRERICIKDAYSEFNDWGVNPINSTTWYTKPNYGKVFTK